MKTVYLASPLGFSEAGRLFMDSKLIPMLESLGSITVEDPWSLTSEEEIHTVQSLPNGDEKRLAWSQLNRVIGSRNEAAIKRSDGMVAVLDGVDVDSGTAAEIGYAFGLGHRIIGYRNDFRVAGDNEGAIVNLQVEHFIYESGGTITTSLDELKTYLQSLTQH